MIYREFQNMKLPMLALGAMRLPTIDGADANIDVPQTERMVDYALQHGVTYFDTAWGYHGGNSESVMGGILSKYPREDYLLATKFPGYDSSNMSKVGEIFEKQLENCQVEYFDFYLFHNVCEANIDAYLDEKYGVLDYLLEQKKRGRIRHLGFSAHGEYGVIKRFLEAYGRHMEFCQLQVNWIDWSLQKAKEKVALVADYGLPTWVMEPVRGGALASLPEEDEAVLKSLRPDEGIPAWSFRFLQAIPEVTLILGGMSSFEHMQENVATFEGEKPLNEEETAALQAIADKKINSVALMCTACKYCLDYCPQELDIPSLISLYNQRMVTGEKDFISPMALAALPEEKKPSACIGCKSCEEVCPQQLGIADALADFASKVA